MAKQETASERYTRILELFKESLINRRGDTLSSICKSHSVSYLGLRSWMKSKGITVKLIKENLTKDTTISSPQTEDSNAFIPITVSPESLDISASIQYLSDIKLAFSDGTMISVPMISTDDVISLIGKYKKMVKSC